MEDHGREAGAAPDTRVGLAAADPRGDGEHAESALNNGAAASTDPHCTFDPTKVPKAVDVFTPAGVLQSNELDYTLHNPVVLAGVSIS